MNLYIGHYKWTLDDLLGRVERKSIKNGNDIYSIDGINLVEFYPVRIESDSKSGNIVIETKRNHRMLFNG